MGDKVQEIVILPEPIVAHKRAARDSHARSES
jgi:hypothetical protein